MVFFVGVVAVTVFSGADRLSFALATFGYLGADHLDAAAGDRRRLDEGMPHLILLAVPLFIFLGSLIEMTGMARAMIQFPPACSATCAAG